MYDATYKKLHDEYVRLAGKHFDPTRAVRVDESGMPIYTVSKTSEIGELQIKRERILASLVFNRVFPPEIAKHIVAYV